MKKVIVAVGILFLLSALSAGSWYFWQRRVASSETSPLITASSASENKKNLTWDDPAGFTLQYSPDLSINKHDEDKDNYAHLEFTNKDHPGEIIVWAKNTNASDITAWVRTERAFSGASILDTSLGNQPAKKILLVGSPKKIIVGSIYDELLFTVETTLDDGGYWARVHENIVNGFAFKPVNFASGQGSISGDSGVGAEEAVDEEEVVQ